MKIASTTNRDRRLDGAAKKLYRQPRLEVYGDIREVTRSEAFGTGGADGTNPPTIFKTQPMQ